MTQFWIGGRAVLGEVQQADPTPVAFDGVPCAAVGSILPTVESFEDAWWPRSRFVTPRFIWWEYLTMPTINMNPSEAGLDVPIPVFVVNGSGVGVTGLVVADVVVRLRSPDGTLTSPVVTFAELDSTNSPGAYLLTVPTARFTMLGLWQLLVYPAVAGSVFGIPLCVVMEIVSQQFPRIGPKFDRFFRRSNAFFNREGIAP